MRRDVEADAVDTSRDKTVRATGSSARPVRRGFWPRIGLGQQILIFMAGGAIAGLVLGPRTVVVQPIGELFLRLLVMSAIPLVFFNLLAGITSLTSLGTFGRVGFRISIYYFATTVFALVLGLTVMHVVQPGAGVRLTGAVPAQLGSVPSFSAVVLEMVPSNVFAAFSQGKLSQVVVFALLLGIAALTLPAPVREPLAAGLDVIAQALRALVGLILYIAPLGIGALMAVTVSQQGAGLFGPLAKFIGAVWLAQAIMVLVYLLLLAVLTPRSPLQFLRQTAPLYATTAATCSSMASLAQAFQVSEEQLKLPRSIYSFTLALGANMNQNGTSITLAALLLFTAQAAGVEFPWTSQVSIVFVGLLLSNGSAGIPGSAVVVALLFVESFNLPVEIAAIVAGVYRLIDMGSTTVNVMGDVVGTVIVADMETGRQRLDPAN